MPRDSCGYPPRKHGMGETRNRKPSLFRPSGIPCFRDCICVLSALIMALCLSSCAPHMYNQASLRPFKQQLPPMPKGATPIQGRAASLVLQEARTGKSATATPTTLKNGRIYYGYYCLMCHGEKGDGNGPVGQSYVPKPTDLTSPSARKMTDAQLYVGMLTGIGHDPVMTGTVPRDHRWPLVAYIRTFAKPSP